MKLAAVRGVNSSAKSSIIESIGSMAQQSTQSTSEYQNSRFGRQSDGASRPPPLNFNLVARQICTSAAS